MVTEFGTPESWGSVQYGWLYDAPTEGQKLWEGEMTETGAQAYLWHGNLLQHIEFDGECWQAGGWYSYVVLPRFVKTATDRERLVAAIDALDDNDLDGALTILREWLRVLADL